VLFVKNGLSDYIHFVPPEGDFVGFDQEEAYIAKGIEWKLFTERSVKKELLYKSHGHEVKVKIVGYEEYGNNMQTIVVEFEDGSLSCIHPAYLKEMQSSSFGKDSLTGEKSDEVSSSKPKSEEKQKKTQSKVKKESAKPKLELPEDKVQFTAKVKEFTSKMNHFKGEEEEVILLERVKVAGENELEIGDAWCGYSKTLKKVELEEGDELAFDGKIVDKKFNKDIRYKINNPSKLEKINKY
jgi:hypothetical protein